MTTHAKQKQITIGRLGAPHGVRGWLKLFSYTEPLTNIFNYHPWHLVLHGKELSIDFVEQRPQGNGLIVRLQGCEDRDVASTYTGAEIVILRSQLPTLPNDEYYWTDLEGLEVINLQEQSLGIVDQVFATGANDVLLVKGKKRHLIPFLREQVILEVDLTNKKIKVDWDPEF